MEIVIVNDGSTDATGSICDRLSAACDNVRVLTLHNEGVSVARNAGIAAAAGEFVTFVDADDRLLPETLQVLYDCMADTESDIAGCRFADRCPYRREACDNPQELYCFGEGHAARCIVAFEEEQGSAV